MTPDIAPASARKPSDVLEAAADLIEPEGAWTQGRLAADRDGKSVPLSHGTCWCAEGAIAKIVGQYCDGPYFAPDAYLVRVVGGVPSNFNDAPGRTQREVVTALRKAAALARSEGQ